MALTPKQLHFARCVASGMTQAAAYREAYDVRPDSKVDTHHQEASRLANNPQVAARIKALIKAREAAVAASAVSDRERVLSKLRTMMDSAEPADAVKLRAAELLGKTVGLFKDVIEQSVTRSPDEIMAELEERMAMLAGDDDEGARCLADDVSEDNESGFVH